jgi:outer membrane protein assembly factor BamB
LKVRAGKSLGFAGRTESGTHLMGRRAFFGVVLALAAISLLPAAGTTVKTGTVESVSPDGQTVTFKFSHSDRATELKVSSETSVRLDGAASELAALKPGMSATVQVGSDGQAERILARTAKDKSSSPSTTKSAKPKLSRKATKTAKTTKTGAKPSSKLKSDASSPLDELPVMMTPLSNLKNPEPKGGSTGAKGSWPCFLGSNHDNISKETGLLRRWPQTGPKLAWHVPGLGQGYSAVSVADGVVFTMGTPENQESLLAINLADGKALWSRPTQGPVFQEEHGNGPRGTPTVDRNYVYALGASGDLICVDFKTKSVRWHKNLSRDFSASVPQYGYSESVLIDGQRLICTPGSQGATVVALDKNSGTVLWKCPIPNSTGAAYASPIVAEIAGTRQYVDIINGAIVGVKATDGLPLWGNDSLASANVICSSPLLVKDYIFAAASYGTGGVLLRLAPGDQGAMQATVVNRTPDMKSHHGGMVAIGSYVYGADDQVLTCFNLETWKVAWKDRSVGRCSITCADGRLYVRGENGEMALLEATPAAYQELGRFMPPRTSDKPAWSYPVVAAGKLFLRDQDELLCYSLK